MDNFFKYFSHWHAEQTFSVPTCSIFFLYIWARILWIGINSWLKQIKYIMMRDHLIEYPCFNWYWESRARLFKTVDKVICWINHLSSGQLLLFKSCPLDKCALSWTTFVKFNWVRIKFYPVDKYDRQLKLHSNFFLLSWSFPLFNFKNSISLFWK
jgi:hypothetical protein